MEIDVVREKPALRVPALLVIAGIVLSGPLAVVLASALAPQPAWRDVATLAAHDHWLQRAPYLFGFLLLVGDLWFVAVAALMRGARERVAAIAALLAAAIYAVLVTINYALQLAVVPATLEHPDDVTAAITMVNPRSLCWAFEMFGYGALGVATWLVAPAFEGSRLRDWIRRLLVANGVVSVAGAAITVVDLAWVMTPAGLALYAAWNLLVLAAMVLVVVDARSAQPSRFEARLSLALR